MTKLTKNEKILRKGNEKWKNFLAEGAFKKTLNESIDFRKAHFAASMKPEELELLNIPEEEYKTKSKEEVEAISAALSKAHEKSQYSVVLKSTATYDENEPILRLIDKKLKVARAITGEKGYYHSSGPEEDEEYRMTYSNDMPSRSGEDNLEEGGTMGEYGKIDAEDGNPPSKIGRGNEEYMAAYNAVLVARGEEPLDIQQPDQKYLDALRSGQLEEKVSKRVAELLSEGLTPEQVKEKILEEGIGDFIRKGADFVKKKTGLGMTQATLEAYAKVRGIMSDYGEFLEREFPTAQEIDTMVDFMKQLGGEAGGKGLRSADAARNAMDKLPKNKRNNLSRPQLLKKEIKKFMKLLDDARDMLPGQGDKTRKKASRILLAAEQQLEGKLQYLRDLGRAFQQALKTGKTEAMETVARLEREEDRRIAKAAKLAFSKEQAAIAKADREAGRQAKRDASRRDDKEQDIVRGKSTQRFGRATNLEENEKKNFKVGEFVRIVSGSLEGATGKVIELVTTSKGEQGYVIELYSSAKMKVFGGPGDEVIATAEDMESGGTTDGMELYDIDERSEEDNLIREKDEKEFAKIFARAEDMLVLSARSRVPVSLKSVQSALDVIKVPSEMEKGKLIVKNEYVIADKNELPESAKQISFTKYAMDYLSNLPGEQLDLPMEEQERPDFVTSYSADPHLDQIEDYALTVIEKGGNLRQLEDVLNRDAFATFLKGDVLTIDDEFFVGNEENFEISPGEDVRRIKGSNLVVGRIS